MYLGLDHIHHLLLVIWAALACPLPGRVASLSSSASIVVSDTENAHAPFNNELFLGQTIA